jgi:hypothetical protein
MIFKTIVHCYVCIHIFLVAWVLNSGLTCLLERCTTACVTPPAFTSWTNTMESLLCVRHCASDTNRSMSERVWFLQKSHYSQVCEIMKQLLYLLKICFLNCKIGIIVMFGYFSKMSWNASYYFSHFAFEKKCIYIYKKHKPLVSVSQPGTLSSLRENSKSNNLNNPYVVSHLNLHLFPKQDWTIFFFFGGTRIWTASTLTLGPLHQPCFVMGFFEIGSRKLLAGAGFQWRSSWSLPPE